MNPNNHCTLKQTAESRGCRGIDFREEVDLIASRAECRSQFDALGLQMQIPLNVVSPLIPQSSSHILPRFRRTSMIKEIMKFKTKKPTPGNARTASCCG
jgi:hypothetical protein